MNRYLITITLSTGEQVQARSVGEDRKDALRRIQALPQYQDFVANKAVRKVSVEFYEVVQPINPKDFVLQKSTRSDSQYLVTDRRNNIVVFFEKGKYNETARIVPLDDFPNDTLETATILREIGEYLALYHEELVAISQ